MSLLTDSVFSAGSSSTERAGPLFTRSSGTKSAQSSMRVPPSNEQPSSKNGSLDHSIFSQVSSNFRCSETLCETLNYTIILSGGGCSSEPSDGNSRECSFRSSSLSASSTLFGSISRRIRRRILSICWIRRVFNGRRGNGSDAQALWSPAPSIQGMDGNFNVGWDR